MEKQEKFEVKLARAVAAVDMPIAGLTQLARSELLMLMQWLSGILDDRPGSVRDLATISRKVSEKIRELVGDGQQGRRHKKRKGVPASEDDDR